MIGEILKETTADEVLARLADGTTVHLNMLSGKIAKPSLEQIIHLFGAEKLLRAILPGVMMDGGDLAKFVRSWAEFKATSDQSAQLTRPALPDYPAGRF